MREARSWMTLALPGLRPDDVDIPKTRLASGGEAKASTYAIRIATLPRLHLSGVSLANIA